MGRIKIPAVIALLVVCIITHEFENVNGVSNQCSTDDDCFPEVECKVTTWECSPSDPLATTPVPGEAKACCEYLDTCDEVEPYTGWIWSRLTKREHNGQYHVNHWTDMFVATGNESYITSQYAGSWNTFTENCTLCDEAEDDNPTEIYVLEPVSACSSGARLWPEWYQIALAARDADLNISYLTLDPPENRSCLCDLDSACDTDTMTCRYTTDLAVGEEPNSVMPADVERHKCFGPLGLECGKGTLNASSIFASGYDEETARFNVWIEADSVEGGWAPNLNDADAWISVLFDLEIWVSAVITQGLAMNIEKRVDSFMMEYHNMSGDTYLIGDPDKVWYAGARFDTEITNYFPQPVRAVGITIHVLTPCDPGYVGMRFELLGCPVCYNNSMCGSGGLCLEQGICNYDGLILNQDNYGRGLDHLKKFNGTSDEKKAYDNIVGYLGPYENITTINFTHVTLKVVQASIIAFTNLTAEGNKTKSENGALNVQKIATLTAIVAHEETKAFANLNTPQLQEEAKIAIKDIVVLVGIVLLPDNVDGWSLHAHIQMGTYDTLYDQGGLKTAEGRAEEYRLMTTTPPPGGGVGDKNEKVTKDLREAEERELEKAETAALMLKSVTTIAVTVVRQLDADEDDPESGQIYIVAEDTIELFVSQKDAAALEGDGFEFDSVEELGVSLAVAASSFIFDEFNGEADVVVAVCIIDTTALRSALEDRPDDIDFQIAGLNQNIGRIASNFLSFEVDVNGGKFSIPIEFSMRHDVAARDAFGQKIESPLCVYHKETPDVDATELADYSADELARILFSPDGLKIKWIKDGETGCISGHLTTFAVLMYLGNVEDLNSNDLKIQSTITLVLSGLSILALVIALGILVYLRTSLMSERVIIHMTLMSTTLAATLAFMFGADKTKNQVLCKVITIILHFLYTAMFSWMLVEGVHLYRQVITVFESAKSQLWIYFVLGWGVPVLIVLVSAAVEWDKYGTGGFCFLKFKDHTLWAFIGPIIPVIIINLVVLVRVARVVVMASKLNDTGDGAKDTVNRVKAGLRSSTMLLPILGITWLFGFIQHLAVALAYIFVILNSLQGFFMAVCQCFISSEVRCAIEQRVKKARDSSLGGNSTHSSQTASKQPPSRMGSSGTRTNKVVPECAIQDVD